MTTPTPNPAPVTEWAAVPAIVGQLERLEELQHSEKMKATIFALVAARIAGRSEETVWSLPETCNRATYHSKWKKHPVFADVLKRVTAAARHYKDTEAARAVAKAAERLAMASPVAAARLAALLQSDDETTVRLAAVNILDRAGLETAAKVQQQQIGSTLEEWRQDAERRRQQVDDMIAEMDDQDEETDEEAAA